MVYLLADQAIPSWCAKRPTLESLNMDGQSQFEILNKPQGLGKALFHITRTNEGRYMLFLSYAEGTNEYGITFFRWYGRDVAEVKKLNSRCILFSGTDGKRIIMRFLTESRTDGVMEKAEAAMKLDVGWEEMNEEEKDIVERGGERPLTAAEIKTEAEFKYFRINAYHLSRFKVDRDRKARGERK